MVPDQVEVLIVGCGPVGLIAAGLLGAAGISTLVIERNPTTSDEAKAISLDDESLRVLQRAGLVDDVYPILYPGTGTRYYGADGRLLVHAKGRQPYRLGHPFKSAFAQPDLERALLDAVRRSPSVQVSFEVELTGLAQSDVGVESTVRLRDGTCATIRSDYVIGCDGAKSTARRQLEVNMMGDTIDDAWIVVDTLNDPHQERFGMHHGEPRRPHVVIPGRNGRCRYEFRLNRGEFNEADPTAGMKELAISLISRFRDIGPQDIERCTAYRFHALVAERWRVGRVLLAGDAAHMMPPFAGQGLNSGVRDVENLCWKLVSVLQGRASDRLLDTYQTERKPHAQAMVDLSARLGRIVMTSKPAVAKARDLVVHAATKLPQSRRYLSEMRFRPAAIYREGFVVPNGDKGLVGRMIPQPRVLDANGRMVLLDDILGPGFALIGVACDGDGWVDAKHLDGLGCRLVDVALDDMGARDVDGRVGMCDADGRVHELLSPYRGQMLLVRPDRFVAAAVPPKELPDVAARLAQFAP